MSIKNQSEISIDFTSMTINPKQHFISTNPHSIGCITTITILIASIITAGFALSFVRYHQSGTWFGNAFLSIQKHNNQYLITLHAIQGVIWTVTSSIQVLLGWYSKSERLYFRRKQLHKFIGKYIECYHKKYHFRTIYCQNRMHPFEDVTSTHHMCL
eukprot:910487_1